MLTLPTRQPVGPLVSKIGLRTVDIGAPILSMHSYGDLSIPDFHQF
jgi:aspartyl aminopeptidase